MVESVPGVCRPASGARARFAGLRRIRTPGSQALGQRLCRQPGGFSAGALWRGCAAPGGRGPRLGRWFCRPDGGAESGIDLALDPVDALRPGQRAVVPANRQPPAAPEPLYLSQSPRAPRHHPGTVCRQGRVCRSGRGHAGDGRGARDLRTTIPGGLCHLPLDAGADELRSRRAFPRVAPAGDAALARAGGQPLVRARLALAERQSPLRLARGSQGRSVCPARSATRRRRCAQG